MSTTLRAYGVEVIAISKDTPAQVQAHKARDGLTFTLLSDPDLKLIDQMGLRHEAALEFRTFFIGPWRFPVGWPAGFKAMAIPTTILLDEDHVVQWVDQADDYRVRGDLRRTLDALRAAFGEPTSPLPDLIASPT